MSEDPVIVAGAGPTGMVAALGLRARGVPVEVYEAEPEDRERPGSRAIFVHGATLRTLDTIHPGLGYDLAEEGMIWPTRRTLFRGEEVFSRTYENDRSAGAGLPPFTSLPQVWTEDVLLDTLEEVGIDVTWDTPVERVETRADGVTVGTGDGETREASYVVGADGAGSTVRKEIGADFTGDQSANSFIIADVEEVSDDPRPPERVFHYDDPDLGGRNLLIVPFQGGWRVDVQCKPDDDPERIASDEVIAEYTARALGERYRDRVEWVSTYQFKQVNAEAYTGEHDRVLLAGEAAHLFAPFGARGMNSG
ncbi:FAD-dependent monooxygenase, partial [Halarchaeum acidiphilum]